MSIQDLTNLVTALRSETGSAAITPEMIGSLLQNIVDTIGDMDVDSCTQSVSSLSSAMQSLVENVKLDNFKTYTYSSSTSMWVASGSQTTNLYLHVFSKKKTVVSVLVPVSTTSASSSSSSTTTSPIKHIQCETQDNRLYVKGAKALIDAGYKAFVFRYTLKSNRLTDSDNHKYHGPKRRGWHRYFNDAMAKAGSDDQIQFLLIDRANGGLLTTYTTAPSNLVNMRAIRTNGVLTKIKVGFGRKTVNCIKGRRFKFGIGFASAQTGKTFDYSTLVTNIAPFHVHVGVDKFTGNAVVSYGL